MSSDDESSPRDTVASEERAADEVPGASSSEDAPPKAAAAAASPATADAASSLTHMKAAVLDRFGETKELAKNPQKLAPMMKTKLNTAIPQNTLKIFFVIWLPFVIMASGTVLGLVFRLVTRGFHYLIGAGAFYYVYTVVNSNQSFQEKARIAILLAAATPTLMLDEMFWFFKLMVVLAFAGTPFLLNYFLPKPGETEKDSKEKEWHDTLLQYSTAPSVIFAVAAGGSGLFNDLTLCVIFGAACLMAVALVEPVSNAIPHPLAKSNKEIVYVLLQIVLACVLLWLMQWIIIPESILEEQNSVFVQLLYIIIGLAIIAFGHILHTGQFLSGIDAKLITNTKEGFIAVVGGAYAILLLEHVAKQWLFSHIARSWLLSTA